MVQVNKAVIEAAFDFTKRVFDACEQIPENSSTSSIRKFISGSSMAIGVNLYRSTFALNTNDMYDYINEAVMSAAETEYYLRLISDRELLDSDLVHELLDKCVYLRKVSIRFCTGK